MKKTTIMPVLTFLLSAAVIAACSLLAKDWYKNDYLEWERSLTEIERSAFSSTHSMLRLHSGFESDYAALQRQADSISGQLDHLTKTRAEMEKESLWQRFQLSIPDVETLHTLGSSFASSTVSFMDISSELRSSTLLALQLLEKMRGTASTNDREWQSNAEMIERRIIQDFILKNPDSGEKPSYIINRMKMSPLSRQEMEHLASLETHVLNIEAKSLAVDKVLEAHFKVERMLGSEIRRLRMRTAWHYEEATKKGYYAEISMALMTLFILIYGTYFALRSIKFSQQLEHNSKNLAAIVKSKTSELEKTIELLSNESDVKNELLTSLKDTEVQLRQRESFFRAITENASDPILIVDAQLFVRFSNSAAHQLFECSETEFIEKGLASHLPSMDSIDKLISLKQKSTVGKTSNGAELKLKVSLNEIEEENGTRYVCIIHNVGNMDIEAQRVA